MADYTVRQGDNFTIADTLEDAAGSPVDIQNAQIKFTLIPVGGGAAILDAVAASNDQNTTGADGSKGKVHYTGSGSSTATPGLYFASWYNATSQQTFPNGGYILFEVTADAPVATATRFAESADLQARLGVTFTADEHIRAQQLLEDASGLIQEHTKQTIALVTNDVYTRPGTFDSRIRLPQRPIVSVSAVTIAGVALVIGSTVYLDGDELVRLPSTMQDSSFGLPLAGFGFPWETISVTYTHGYATVPALVKSICLEAVIRVWINPGAVIQDRVGDTSTIYAPFTGADLPVGLLLTAKEKDQLDRLLRRHSGTVSLR